MTNDPRLKIGSRLKEAREYLGLSQEEAAVVAKVSRSAISLIESGQRKLDSVELMALAKLYRRPMAYFTNDDFSVELDPEAAVFARSFSELSDDDKKELAQFAEFLAARSNKKE
ncbi:MAG: helix-turn-helix transcriptional regulator [Candidatus Thiodiazotropha taylori]